ncbi:unnamed protein product [Blepharisma stoltei]|uniref:3-hydroxyisobutyryl-CoA hydrolase n=1 Tax=Blepharisma stoltei TaxID=1481888 RepID=A0AAU9IGV1_9CILI|nr:unnamed protein product [Blepharisma stoltei]
MSRVVIQESYGPVCKLLLNRPKNLNALNFELAQALDHDITIAEKNSQKIILASTSERAFQAGADLYRLLSTCHDIPNWVGFSYNVIKRLYKHPFETLSVWQGHIIGYGVGVGMACKYSLALPSTLWCMPEHHIGVVPDAGCSHLLSHLQDEAYGLYLFLTSRRISGIDCYYSGICTHYTRPENLPHIFSEIEGNQDSVKNILNKYKYEPEKELSRYLKHKDEIKEAFTNPSSIEEILEKLENNNTEFSRETSKEIRYLCPLSVRMALEHFKSGKQRTFLESLDSDFLLDCNLMTYKNQNFIIGVTTKMIEKSNARPNWVPNSLSEVTYDMVYDHLRIDKKPELNFTAQQS